MKRLRARIVVLGAFLAAVGSASAQSASFSPQLFHPAPGPDDFVTVESAQPLHHLQAGAGVYFDYARDPLSILTYSSRTGDPYGTRVQIQSHVLGGEVWAGLGLWERAQIAVSLPMTLYQVGNPFDTGTPLPDGTHVRPPVGFALGDPRLYLKLRLYGRLRGFQLAVSHWLSVPVGNDGALGGEPHFRGFAGEPRVLGEWVADRWRVGLQVGFAWHARTTDYYTAGAGQQITYALGVAVDAVRRRLRIMLELYGHHDFHVDYTAASPLELDVSARVFLVHGLSVTGGVGYGVLDGAGAPSPRVFAGLGYVSPTHDRDGDGIPDSVDKCPDVAEDRDGFEDEDGCPDFDDDHDSIADAIDRCPRAAEDFDGFQDEDGCPDPDNDHDGIPDIKDGCPNDAEDGKPPHPNDGCPASKTDQDGDGVPDSVDKCPNDPEDKDGFQDEDGCPDPDNDEDGIPDQYDECPNVAEDLDGVDDDDGCPDAAGKIALKDGDLVLKEAILADGTSPAAASLPFLDQVAKALVGRAALQVRIEAYWDKRGDRAQADSQLLAEAVRNRLVEHGVATERLVAVGYGWVGKNGARRVELHVIKQKHAAPAAEEPAEE